MGKLIKVIGSVVLVTLLVGCRQGSGFKELGRWEIVNEDGSVQRFYAYYTETADSVELIEFARQVKRIDGGFTTVDFYNRKTNIPVTHAQYAIEPEAWGEDFMAAWVAGYSLSPDGKESMYMPHSKYEIEKRKFLYGK